MITAPLLQKSLVGGWLIVFIVASRELSAAIFLVGPKTRTMAVLLYDLSEAGNFEQLAAFGGILLAITMVLVAAGIKLAGGTSCCGGFEPRAQTWKLSRSRSGPSRSGC